MGIDTRSGVEVLATDEDNRCLGKRNQCRVSKDRAGTIQYSRDRLNERCENVKVPESSKKSQLSQKRGQKRASARIGDQCLLGLGQWSQYLHSVGVNPLGICPDLWTQKSVWPGKFSLQGKSAGGGIALGFGDADLHIYGNQETISSALDWG